MVTRLYRKNRKAPKREVLMRFGHLINAAGLQGEGVRHYLSMVEIDGKSEGRKDKEKVVMFCLSKEEFEKIVIALAEGKAGKDAVAEFFRDNSRS